MNFLILHAGWRLRASVMRGEVLEAEEKTLRYRHRYMADSECRRRRPRPTPIANVTMSCQQATYTIPDSDVLSRCSTQPGYHGTANKFPIRSPLLVADYLISKVAGKRYVEIGTRDGDLFDCIAPHAKQAISIEMDPAYCRSLRQRGHTVVCGQLNASSAGDILPNADVYFWWIYNKYNLQIVRWIDTELKRRGQRGTLYFPLTAELLTEQDALVKQAQYLERFHSGGLDQRLFFQEKATPNFFQPPKGYCSAKGPGASWGIFSMLRGEVGLQAKRRGAGKGAGKGGAGKGAFGSSGGSGGSSGTTSSSSSAVAVPTTPPALQTPASAYADAQHLACGRPAYALADARCLGSPSMALQAEYPERSPLTVADFLADAAAAAGATTVGVLSVEDRDEEADLAACLASPLQPGRLRVRTMVVRRAKEASLPARGTRVWYVRASGARSPSTPAHRYDWALEIDLVRRLRAGMGPAAAAATVATADATADAGEAGEHGPAGGKRRQGRAAAADAARTGSTLYLGLDGYSVSMATLPSLLRTLNMSSAVTGSRGVGSVTLTRIGFDESTPRHRVGSRDRGEQQQQQQQRRHVHYARDLVSWGQEVHRYGMWHMVSVEIGG